jgi:dolichol-phosphate mannosyltransferase
MDKLYIIVPAYNEAANIERFIEDWLPVVESISSESKLVIFDDGSTDDTFDILSKIKSRNNQLLTIQKKNSGHGATLLYGYKYAIESGADFIFQTDSDGQTDPKEFWAFWLDRKEFDFQIGYRRGRQDGFGRVIVTVVLKILIFIVFKKYVKDANTPFRLMNANRLKQILKLVPVNHFLSNVLISVLVIKRKELVSWKPITFKPRQGGINSINFKKIFKVGLNSVNDFIQFKNNLK